MEIRRVIPKYLPTKITYACFIWVTHVVVALLIAIIARPQSSTSWKNITSEGIDIVIALDISGSMLSKDFHPNRLKRQKK